MPVVIVVDISGKMFYYEAIVNGHLRRILSSVFFSNHEGEISIHFFLLCIAFWAKYRKAQYALINKI